VNLRVPKGRHAYRLRCVDSGGVQQAAVAEGTVTILHDAGTAPLAAGAPSTMVDTDGRAYTVMYQNRLPAVSVRWPHPPEAPSYTLLHTSPAGSRSYTTSSPMYGFKSGAFIEGRHQLSFQAGAKQSRPTTLLITFDATAPKASLKTPANGRFGPGASVNVSGTVLPGCKVFAGGSEIGVEANYSFSGNAAAAGRVLTIRFECPGRGSDLYLRRASGVAR
jgi:hypothetical protein